MEISDFLVNLRVVATSPYAFAAYVAVTAAWTYTTIARHRLERIAQLLKDLPPDDRTKVIMREYSTAPRSGLSADQWIKSRRHLLMFVGFLSVLICATLIVIVTLVLTASGDGRGSIPDEIKRLRDTLHLQSRDNLLLRQEVQQLKQDFSAYQASGAGLKMSLSSFNPAQPKRPQANRELIASIQGVGNEYGFGDLEIDRVLGDPSIDVDDKLVFIRMAMLNRIDIDIEEQAKQVNELQQTANQGIVNDQSIDVETMKLKRLIDRRGQMFDLLRQIIDKYNETAKGIIDAIGR